MNASQRLKALALLWAVSAIVVGGLAIVSAGDVAAAPCRCKVMVCSQAPPYACWEKCVTCPKFP